MTDSKIDIKDIHWMIDMLQSIDVGLMVLDRSYRIMLWNSFMENHSGLRPMDVQEKVLFDVFPKLPENWFKKKAESVFLLKTRAFSTWEQRPYLFRFKTYRPITGTEPYMYQNFTLIPIMSTDGYVDYIGVVIYDMTDSAVNRRGLEKANDELARLSCTDKLTTLYNRGYWEECLANEFKRTQRGHNKSTLVMFDIDHFKKVNDTYGHQTGDKVIQEVARILRDNLRETDIAGRYGGEEFAVILVDTLAQGGKFFAERLRKKVEASEILGDGHRIRCTISLGIAETADEIKDHGSWLELSDQALYASKRGGRNRTTVHGE